MKNNDCSILIPLNDITLSMAVTHVDSGELFFDYFL